MSIRHIIIENVNKRQERIDEIKIEDVDFAIQYLKYYGYINEELPANTQGLINFEKAVIQFQEFFQLDIDGLLGPKTLRAMSLPRCKMKDVESASQYGWNIKNLTYFIEAYTNDLPKSEVDAIIDLAFQAWENVCNLKIERTNSRSAANLIVGLGSGRADGFDGPSGTLAWNELPTLGTRQVRGKFDEAETWIGRNGGRGIKLLNVACHEFGHGLGLVHSKVNGALMAPYYNSDIAVPQKNDDVSRIQALYGKPVVIPTPTPIPPPTPNPTKQTVILELEGLDIQVKRISIPGVRTSIIG